MSSDMTKATAQKWLLDLPCGEFAKSLTLYSEPYVKIRIEPGSSEYTLAKALLCRQSLYFTGMFEGDFKESTDQSATLEEIDGVLSIRSFEMLVQWLYSGKVHIDEIASEEAITAAIEFIRLADMFGVTGMEDLIAGSIKAMILGKTKVKKRVTTIVHQSWLTSEHIMSSMLLPKGHPVRKVLTLAAVPAYLNRASYLSEALKIHDFAVDLLEEMQFTTKSFQSDGSCITMQDPLSDARIALVPNDGS